MFSAFFALAERLLHAVSPVPAALVTASLSADPFLDEGRAVREFDPARFGGRKEHHGITVNQLNLRKGDGNDTALLKPDAKDFQVVPCTPATDAKNDTPFDPNSFDPAGHRFPRRSRDL